jgi:protein arginine kinase
LIHSYQIEAVEALNAISLLKLGVDLRWVLGITMEQLNLLFFNCRRAHLLCQFKEKIPQEEILHKRAEFIHKTLKGVELAF